MKNYNLLTLLMTVTLLTLFGCKKDTNVIPSEDDTLKIEGEWQIQKINFLDDEAKWDESLAFTSANYFGYAPAMFGGMMGFDFTTRKESSGKGQVFEFVSDAAFGDGSTVYWYWNYIDEGKGFEIVQINKALPPYDFSVMNIKNVKLSEDKQELTFNAELNSRRSGKPITDKVIFPVEFTLHRGTLSNLPDIYIQGVKMEEPPGEVKTPIEKITGVTWKLKSGSDLYDPGLTDTDNPDKGYMKVLALELGDDDVLNYRYAYPMGVVSTKQYTQTKLGDEILEVQMGGTFGTPITVYEFLVESVDLTAGTLILKSDGVIREFTKIEDINADIDKGDYNVFTE